MITIAEKKKGLAWIYIISVILGLGLIIVPIFLIQVDYNPKAFLNIIMGIIVLILGIYMLYGIASTPNKVITYNTLTGILFINQKKKILITNVEHISYKKARSKSIEYKWGTVIINKTITCKFVKDCEEVANNIMKLKNEFKEF